MPTRADSHHHTVHNFKVNTAREIKFFGVEGKIACSFWYPQIEPSTFIHVVTDDPKKPVLANHMNACRSRCLSPRKLQKIAQTCKLIIDFQVKFKLHRQHRPTVLNNAMALLPIQACIIQFYTAQIATTDWKTPTLFNAPQ